MEKPVSRSVLTVIILIVLYLISWPVPIDPVSWQAPPNPGYTGPFEPNELLTGLEQLPLGGLTGPEDIAFDSLGRIYASTHEGFIVRLDADGSNPLKWAETGGRPLGIDFDAGSNLVVADAYNGLLSITPDGTVVQLADSADGLPILYADDVDVAADGRIYFSDASTKFGAKEWKGSYSASLLDIMEHGGHGRLLVYNPADNTTNTLLDNLNFANGVAVSHDQTYVLVNETGIYRVMRFWLHGPRKGQSEPLLENLPAFPDNLSTGRDGLYWVALISPRNRLLDMLSDKPFVRKMVQRLPAFVRPQAESYGHIIAIDDSGNVIHNLQDPQGGYPQITSVVESDDYLYLGSLIAPSLARLLKDY